MTNLKYIFLLLSVLLSYSCVGEKKGRVVNDCFLSVDSIYANKIRINEVFNPVSMVILDDFYVFQNEYADRENGNFFYVYNAEDMSFCYSFGKLGNGGYDFLAPRIVQNNEKNTFSIVDSRTFKLFKYELTADGEKFIENKKIDGIRYPIQEISFVNDSILLFLVMTNENLILYSYNYNEEIIIDDVIYDTGFKNRLEGDFLPAFNECRYSNYKNKYSIAFHHINELIVGHVDDNGFFKEKDYQFSNNNFTPDKNRYDNILYYLYTAGDEEFIFAQYYGYKFRELAPFPLNLGRRHFDFLIEVYDWDRNPITLLSLDEDIMRMYIDSKKNKMYAWNPLKDFDYLLEYDICFLYNL